MLYQPAVLYYTVRIVCLTEAVSSKQADGTLSLKSLDGWDKDCQLCMAAVNGKLLSQSHAMIEKQTNCWHPNNSLTMAT